MKVTLKLCRLPEYEDFPYMAEFDVYVPDPKRAIPKSKLVKCLFAMSLERLCREIPHFDINCESKELKETLALGDHPFLEREIDDALLPDFRRLPDSEPFKE